MADHKPVDRHIDTFWIEADVVDIQPLMRTVQVTTPREVCWDEPVRQSAQGGYRSHTPKLVGGIIGGVVGNQFGGGRGNDIMTIAGALLGASMGRDAGYRRQIRNRNSVSMERRCEIEEIVHQEERLEGYRVTYEYGGRTFVTQTPQDPGQTIRVRVSVQPLTYNLNGMSGWHASRKPDETRKFKS